MIAQPRLVRCYDAEHIKLAVMELMGVNELELMGACRDKRLIRARRAYIGAVRHFTKMSYPEIARTLQKKHHTTVHDNHRLYKQTDYVLLIDGRQLSKPDFYSEVEIGVHAVMARQGLRVTRDEEIEVELPPSIYKERPRYGWPEHESGTEELDWIRYEAVAQGVGVVPNWQRPTFIETVRGLQIEEAAP